MKEAAAKKEVAAKKEPVAAVKKETAQASCRRRPSPPPLACHILCSACNQTSPLSNTLRSKAPGSWWRNKQSRRSRRADAAPVTLSPPLPRPIHIGPTTSSRDPAHRHHILSSHSYIISVQLFHSRHTARLRT